MVMMIMMVIMTMPVFSDIFLLTIAFISLNLALEVFKTICSIKC
jgi:hypothetical protein